MAEDITKNIPKEILLRAVISKNIKKLRVRYKLTQVDLALCTGINRVTIAKYESCQMSISLNKLLTIAKALEVSPNDLLDGWETLF